jgi:hypothetical protein
MTAKKKKPIASYTVNFYENSIEVEMDNFGYLTHGRIERSMTNVLNEQNRLRAQATIERRKREAESERVEKELQNG